MMIWKSSLLAVFAVLGITTHAATAQDDAELKACIEQSKGVSTEMLKCGKIEIDKWDARLNTAYRALLQKTAGNARARLRNEQRAWLRHHLRETSRLAADPNNGSVAFLDSQAFELSDLSERTLALEQRLNGNK